MTKESENKPKVYKYETLIKIVERLRDDFNNHFDVILLYAFNRTGKTRLSMDFKDKGKKDPDGPNTLYFNAYTEDLFSWENDLEHNEKRYLKMNQDSKFFQGLKGLALEEKIHNHLNRYAQIDFKIDYDNWQVIFSKEIPNHKYHPNNKEPKTIIKDYIKVSRGEETIFMFSFFMAICETAIEGNENYKWVKYIYIDDPISSLDESNAIIVAVDLASIIIKDLHLNKETHKNYVISSHHGLFYNVMHNELKNKLKNKDRKYKSYFFHKAKDETYRLQATDDTPFFHHIEQLCEINEAVKLYEETEQEVTTVVQSNILKTHHFNMLRAIFEKTSAFFGKEEFSYCIEDMADKELYSRAVNLLSHGTYSLFSPVGMMKDTSDLFVKIFKAFIDKYKFELPDIFFNK